jgi:hypothetical protein
MKNLLGDPRSDLHVIILPWIVVMSLQHKFLLFRVYF